jgi:hypothetical protein
MSISGVSRYSCDPDPYFVGGDVCAVNISKEALRSVAFIGVKKRGKFQPRATAFFVGYIEDQHHFSHLVTAEHVISGLLTKKYDIWLRVNLIGGNSRELELDPQAFRFHPDNERDATDVAVCPCTPKIEDNKTGAIIELDSVSLSMNGEPTFYPSDEFARESIVLGAEIAIIGLFRSHHGANRNVPIIRAGNICALLGEPVFTKYAGYIKAYLVEARSIAGLSGSPVIVLPDPGIIMAKALVGQKQQQDCALLGLMHGHFDVQNLNEDVVSDDNEPMRSIHTGIGIVVPVEKIIETINHPELVGMRKTVVRKLRKSGAIPDIAPNDDTKADEVNPYHKEDFMRLVDVAARKRPQGDQT